MEKTGQSPKIWILKKDRIAQDMPTSDAAESERTEVAAGETTRSPDNRQSEAQVEENPTRAGSEPQKVQKCKRCQTAHQG